MTSSKNISNCLHLQAATTKDCPHMQTASSPHVILLWIISFGNCFHLQCFVQCFILPTSLFPLFLFVSMFMTCDPSFDHHQQLPALASSHYKRLSTHADSLFTTYGPSFDHQFWKLFPLAMFCSMFNPPNLPLSIDFSFSLPSIQFFIHKYLSLPTSLFPSVSLFSFMLISVQILH